MSISSTGIYGNTSILNSEIYTDIINEIEDINTNKIRNLILDISENTSNINDISNNRTVSIETDITDISNNRTVSIETDTEDISNNRIVAIETDITDISNNGIVGIETNISTIETNISTIETDITTIKTDITTIKTDITTIETDITTIKTDITTIETDITTIETDISQNLSYITLNRLDIDDISLNKHFIQQLQTVDYSILLANAPSQIPTPPIQKGYNAVIVNNDGINFITQNFGPSSKVMNSLLQINSEDALDESTKIITKGLHFKNAIDNSTQLIINNDGLFILDLSNN